MFTKIESNGNEEERLVIVKYFLDRAGYGLANSSARLWKGAPATCTAPAIRSFLESQGLWEGADVVLAEVYLDKYEAYMALDAMEHGGIVFDYAGTTAQDPGILSIRFTDLCSGDASDGTATTNSRSQTPPPPPAHHGYCTLNPVGLFAFSLTIILETADLYGKLFANSVHPAFVLIWGPYAFWISGILQLIVGLVEASRNNVYGATAFSAFGCFWLANGTKLILTAYFPDQIPEELLKESDPVGNFIRNLYIMAFVAVLLHQTLVGSKLSTMLMALVIMQLFATALNGWHEAFLWMQMIVSTLVSLFAFYVFAAELTNEVYGRQVFHLYPWKADSPEQVFAAAGRSNKLMQLHATKLRAAHEEAIAAQSPQQQQQQQQESDAKTKQVCTFHDWRSASPAAVGKEE